MKLQFTNGYRPRFDQISRIMKYLLGQEEQKKISRQEIVSNTGIPDRQVENLNSMMTGFGLIKPGGSTLTTFGKIVILSDPYFEKMDTLWILHYIVSSNPKWVVWYRMVNSIIPFQDQFSVNQISTQYFADLGIHYSEKTISEKIPKEVGAVLSSYTRSELSRLHILEEVGTGNFSKSTPEDIQDLAFLFCLLYYRDKHAPGSSAINITDVCFSEFSPGKVINIPEFQIRIILGNLHNASLIRLEQFANLDQVRFSDSLAQDEVLSLIYRG